LLLGHGEGFFDSDFAVFLTFCSNEQDRAGSDFSVDARAAFGGRRRLLRYSANYDRLLSVRFRQHKCMPRADEAARLTFWFNARGCHPLGLGA